MENDKKIINLNAYFNNKEKYYLRLFKLKDNILNNYEKRNKIIYFKLNNIKYKSSISNFLTQYILFIPFLEFNKIPNNDFIIIDELKNFNKNILINYFNKIIEWYYNKFTDDNDETINILNQSFAKMITILSDISGQCNIYSATTINLHDLIMIYDENKEFRDLVNEAIPNKLDFSEIETFLNNKFDKIMTILKNEDTVFKPYFISKTGINLKQFKEVVSSVGLKADLDGNIINKPISRNYLIGLDNITDYFIGSQLARKATIVSHKETKNSGYLTRKMSLALMDKKSIATKIKDCGSTEYLEKYIDCDETLDRYNLRYYLDEETNKLKLCNSNNKELIGKTLKFRTPIKCKCKNAVCPICYGKLAKVNRNIHIGLEAVLELTEQITQKLLSSKHLQQVITTIIEWCAEFLKYFVIDTGFIFLNPEKNSGYILIDEDDYDINENGDIIVNKFNIRSKNGIETTLTAPIEIMLSDYYKEKILDSSNSKKDKNNRFEYSFKSINSEEEPFFTFSLENNELSKSLKQIIDLLEKAEHLGITNIDELANKFISLLNEGGINLSAVHAELILSVLVRDKNNELERTKSFNEEDYVILTISQSILKSSSAGPSLSFEELKKQIKGHELYLKTGFSILDTLFFS